MNKAYAVLLLLLLSACGRSGISGLPSLATGDAIIRHYNCAGGEGMDVEYAYMGGTYSATMKINDNKKVLNREDDGVFRLSDWVWQSSDNYTFALLEAGNVLRSDCVAMNEAAVDDKRNVRKSLFNDDKDFERPPHRQ